MISIQKKIELKKDPEEVIYPRIDLDSGNFFFKNSVFFRCLTKWKRWSSVSRNQVFQQKDLGCNKIKREIRIQILWG